MLKDMTGYITTSIKAKKKLVQRSAFPSLSKKSYIEPSVWPEVAY